MKLAMISPSIRRDLHEPLSLFQQVTVNHFYFEGERPTNSPVRSTRLANRAELNEALSDWDPDLVQAPEPFFHPRYLGLLLTIYRSEFPYFIPWLETRSPTRKFGRVLGTLIRAITRPYVERAAFVWPVTELQAELVRDLDYQTTSLEPSLWGTWGTRVEEQVEPGKRFRHKRFLFLGRLEAEKGIEDLLEAWSAFPDELDWRLDIAGKGSLEGLVRRHAEQSSDLRYLGFLKGQQLQAEWDRVSVLVSPSRATPGWEEQVGMSNLQALGRGCPVISTRTGAIPYFVKHGENGLLTRPESPKSLKRLMVTVARDPERYERLSRNALRSAGERFDREKVVREAEGKLLEQVEGREH